VYILSTRKWKYYFILFQFTWKENYNVKGAFIHNYFTYIYTMLSGYIYIIYIDSYNAFCYLLVVLVII